MKKEHLERDKGSFVFSTHTQQSRLLQQHSIHGAEGQEWRQ
jgi:hypothetical protein